MDENNHSDNGRRILEIELAQACETFRCLLQIVVSAFGIFVAADVALMGYAVANQRAILVGIGAIFPLAGLALLLFAGTVMAPALYTGLTIENELRDRLDLFFWSLVATMASPYLPVFGSIISLKDPQERLAALRRQLPHCVPLGNLTVVGLVALAALQVVAMLALAFALEWAFI